MVSDTGTGSIEETIAHNILHQHTLDKKYKKDKISFEEYKRESIENGNGWSECAVCDWGSPRGDATIVGTNKNQRIRFFCPLCGSNINRLSS